MPFLKVPKMFRRSGGSSGKSGKAEKIQERSHQNIGELPSSPANKKKAAKKITRTERKIAKRAAKAEKRAAKNGHGSLYGQGSPGSPQNGGKAPTYRGQSGTTSGGTARSNAGNQSPGSASAGASVADRSMNPVLDQVVRKPSFNTSSKGLSGRQNGIASSAGATTSSRYGQKQLQQQQQQIQPKQLQYDRPSAARSRGVGPVDLDDDVEATTTDEENNNFSPDEFMNPQPGAIVSVNGNGNSYGYNSKYDLSTTNNSNKNGNNSTSSLNHHQLQQFEQQQRSANGTGSGLYGQQHHNVTRLPNGQLVAYDSPDRTGRGGGSNPASPTYSSDFCLSTDNEDESYNQMRRNASGRLPGAPPGSNLPPALDSPDNDSMMYTDDEGGTLFANLRGQLSEEEETAVSPPMSPDDMLPPPPSGMKAPLPAGAAAAAAAAGRYQGPRDPDGDLSQMDPPSMEEEGDEPGRISIAPMSDLRSWSTSPDKSKVTTATTGTSSSRSGLADGSSAGSVENHNPNPHGQVAAPRYTFADENEATAVHRKGQKNENRPGSPSPGYKVNGGSSNGGNNRGAAMYPDSTDSEFETVPVPNGNLLPAMGDGSRSGMHGAASAPGVPNAQEQHRRDQQQRAQAQDLEQQQQHQQQPQQTVDAFGDSFANFANFDSNFDPFAASNGGAQAGQQGQGPSNDRLMSSNGFDSSAPTFIVEGGPTGKGGQRSSTGPSPLDDLVALQKERDSSSKSSRRSRKDPSKSSSSINSAPVITSDYLRKTHKLGSAAGDASSASGRRKSSSRHSESGARSTTSAGSSSAAMAAKDKLRQRRREKERARSRAAQEGSDDDASDGGDRNESWLFDGVTGTLGPRGIAADLESLGGRSNRSKNSTGNRSHRSHRSHRSSKSRRRKNRSDASVGSRDSRYSHKSYRSSRSQMSHMSEQSRSVANDLLRLEMQLAMVGAQKGGDGDRSVGSRRSKTSRGESSSRRSAVSKKTKVTVVAPPGKLGIILANKTDSKGTVVSGVRTSSVLADKISPGDRITAIDGEDVSRMTVSEITTIMARKAEFERVLTVLTSVKTHRSDDLPSQIVGGGEMASVTGSSVTSFSQSYR